ncbi:MAG: hypothetical protein Q9162_002063 [Coniocarpon cinnabarinum]
MTQFTEHGEDPLHPESGTVSYHPPATKSEHRNHHRHGHHLHHHNLRKTHSRLSHLVHPDGRRYHIAQDPAEAESLRRTLPRDDGIEICVHGSDEHMEALRCIYSDHNERRCGLQEQYGDMFLQAEGALLEMEALSEELRRVTDRPIQFSTALNRYGYSVNVRAREKDLGSTGTSLNNIPSDSTSMSSCSIQSSNQQLLDEFHALKFQGEAMRVWRRPILRQYFHKGLLWRAQEEEQTASYELFLDLIYVGIIAISGDNAAEAADGNALLRFSTTFLACLVGFTTNISEYMTETYTPLVSYYLGARLFIAAYLLLTAWLVPIVRVTLLLYAVIIVLPAGLWIGGVHLMGPPCKALQWVAIFFDLFGIFKFYPANNIEHRIDRTNAFVTLVFGYSVVSLLYSSSSPDGFDAFLGKAILGLLQAFALNTLYFEIDSFNLHLHAFRRAVSSALLWMLLHLPMILAFVLSGAALSRLVLTDDVSGTSATQLAPSSQLKSDPDISEGLRWFYTGGLGIGMLCLSGISKTHVYRKIQTAPGSRFPFIFKRQPRFLYRAAVGFTIVFLGFAENLNSLQLISVTTALIISALIVELTGNIIVGCHRHLHRKASTLSESTIEGHGHKKTALADWWRAMKRECIERKCQYRTWAHSTKHDEGLGMLKRTETVTVKEADAGREEMKLDVNNQ